MDTMQMVSQVKESAEKIQNDDPANVSLEIGENIRQGDLYIVRVGNIPASAKPRKNRQLADGDTQGSRHVLEGGDLFDAPATDAAAEIARVCKGAELRDYQIGPMFKTDSLATVTHPEHGDRTVTEPGCYAVVFQRALTADEREERARD